MTTVNQNLNGYKFDVIDGIPSYKAGADAVWVPLGDPVIKFFALVGTNNSLTGFNGTLNYADYISVSYHNVGGWTDIYATFTQNLSEKIMILSTHGGGLHFNGTTITNGQIYDNVAKDDQIWLNYQYSNYTDIIIICYGV